MCISKSELESKANEYREMKALLDETQAIIDSLKADIIPYFTENGIDTEYTDSGKVTYKLQSRSSLDKKALETAFGDMKPFTKTNTYNVLRVS